LPGGTVLRTLVAFSIGVPMVIGAWWLFLQLDNWSRDRRQKRLSPANYEACIAKENAEFVRNCYDNSLAADLAKTRAELPVMMSREERIKDCRANLAIAKAQEKYFPEAPSACGKKP